MIDILFWQVQFFHLESFQSTLQNMLYLSKVAPCNFWPSIYK